MDLQKLDKLIVGKVMADETPSFGYSANAVIKHLDINMCPVCGSSDTEWSDTDVYTNEEWDNTRHDVLYIYAGCCECEAEWTIASALSPLQTVLDVETIMPFLERNHPDQHQTEILKKEINELAEALEAKKNDLIVLLAHQDL